MKMRHVFSTPDLATAKAAMDAARGAGVHDDDILLIARSDIELDSIPDGRKEADTDLMPAAARGMGLGAGAGLLAGLLAVVITPLGLTLAGAMVGGLGSALFGSALPDPIRQTFDDQIKAGNILVVVDGPKELLDAAEREITATGAVWLPFEASKAMS